MPTIKEKSWTNRDLYLRVAELSKHEAKNRRTLDEYLRALWSIGCNLSNKESISLDDFVLMLRNAFHSEPMPYNNDWSTHYRGVCDDIAGFNFWRHTILSQIVDLREMEKSSILADEYRYFGVDAPSGLRWYNFDPITFLECAAVGSYGGWQPGDDTGREYVPGPVVVCNTEGEITTCDPREIENPIVAMDHITWDEFAEFMRTGQWYE